MVPATQPAQASISDLTCAGSGSTSTMSETATRPPGLSTRNASFSTAVLSMARLMTQLEMTTSTAASARGIASMVPLRKVALSTPARALFSLASSSISSVMSTPYACPPGATRRAESSTSRPAPLPRSRTTSPACNCASAVGLPQPRLAPRESPRSATSAFEYSSSPMGPLMASDPPQQVGSQQLPPSRNLIAVSAYFARTESRMLSMKNPFLERSTAIDGMLAEP